MGSTLSAPRWITDKAQSGKVQGTMNAATCDVAFNEVSPVPGKSRLGKWVFLTQEQGVKFISESVQRSIVSQVAISIVCNYRYRCLVCVSACVRIAVDYNVKSRAAGQPRPVNRVGGRPPRRAPSMMHRRRCGRRGIRSTPINRTNKYQRKREIFRT